jgi:hypothetical protein
MPTAVRITFDQFEQRDLRTRALVVGALSVGTANDDLESLVSGGKTIVLAASDVAENRMRVAFRDREDADALRLAALRRLLLDQARTVIHEAMASGGSYQDLPDSIDLTGDDVMDFAGRWPQKVCSFQRRTPPGLVCDATSAGPPKTSVPLCESCSLPDDRVRCTALSHPSIASEPRTRGLTKAPAGALCDGGHDERVGDFTKCRIGGNTCWRQDLPFGIDGGHRAPDDSPERLLDEFSHLRLALERARIKVAIGSGELQLGATLAGPCADAEDMVVRIQALASLIGQLDGHQVARTHGLELPPNTGKLASLGHVLTHLGASGHEGAISLLRIVPALRNQAPAHPKFDDAALQIARLGVELPISDWRVAWLTVADRARGALREIRLAIEARDVDVARANLAAEATATLPD